MSSRGAQTCQDSTTLSSLPFWHPLYDRIVGQPLSPIIVSKLDTTKCLGLRRQLIPPPEALVLAVVVLA